MSYSGDMCTHMAKKKLDFPGYIICGQEKRVGIPI